MNDHARKALEQRLDYVEQMHQAAEEEATRYERHAAHERDEARELFREARALRKELKN